MAKQSTNTAASVHARLLNQARAGSRSFNDLLQLYAMERFLHRLSRTRHADRFVLKGALLMRAWETSLFRTTRDIDLLARSRPKAASRPAHRGLPCVQRRREIPPCDGIPTRCFRQEYSAP
jgi:hypothetical protein